MWVVNIWTPIHKQYLQNASYDVRQLQPSNVHLAVAAAPQP